MKDIIQYTSNKKIFTTVSDDTLLRNYTKYVQYLSAGDKGESYPNMKKGYALCVREMNNRGIKIVTNQ